MKKILGIVLILVLSLSLFSKTYKITLLQQDFSPYSADDVQYSKFLTDKFYEKTGIKVDLQLVPIPSGNYAEKVNVLLASGDIPDIIWFRDNVDIPYAAQGLLLDLTSMVKNSLTFQKNMPQWDKTRLSNYPYLIAIQPMYGKTLNVKTDLLNSLGLKIPVTIDDYYKMLKALKEKTDYSVTSAGDLVELDWVFSGAFGVNKTWIEEDGKYVYSKVSSKEKELLTFYRKLYSEGLLDPEFLTTNWQIKEDKLYNGTVAAIVGTTGIVVDLYQQRNQERGDKSALTPLYPPTDSNGKSHMTATNLSREDRGYAITKTCKNPDIAFKFLEFMASDEGQYIDKLGLEGREYDIINGKIVRNDRGMGWWPRFFDVPSWNSPVELMGEAGKASQKITNETYDEDNYFPMPVKYATKWDEMVNLYKEYSVKIVTGEYSVDKFDEFVTKWYKAGGEIYTQLANEHFGK